MLSSKNIIWLIGILLIAAAAALFFYFQKPMVSSKQQALEIAQKIIAESQVEYDTSRDPIVDLNDGQYVVTFLLPREQGEPARAGDYAMQIWIDAKTGEVLKKLVSP